MPTIEIVSLERNSPLKITPEKYSFQIWQSTKVISHRSLFQGFLNDKLGVMLHLANQECRKHNGFWFASTLIDHNFNGSTKDEDESDSYFRFDEKYLNGIRNLIDRAYRLSPIKQAYFLTDYQFGGKPNNPFIKTSIGNFWLLHDKVGLCWNTLYELSDSY